MKTNLPVVTFLCILLAAFAGSALGADVTLAWDPQSNSSLAGYNLYYGTASNNYGNSLRLGNVTTHTVSGLGAGTYYFVLTAYDGSGAETGFSNEATATITAAAPVISSVSVPVIASTSASVFWKTDAASDSQVDYGLTANYGNATALNTAAVTSHTVNLSSLAAGGTYHFRVKSRNSAGVLSVSGDSTFTTLSAGTNPPVVSSVSASGISSSSAVISWNTDQPSDSQIEYGPTASYGQSTVLNTSMVNAHSQTLTGLSTKTLYHYRVRSRNAAGQVVISGDFTFRTSANNRKR